MEGLAEYLRGLGLSEASERLYGRYAAEFSAWLGERGLMPEHSSYSTLTAYTAALRERGQSPASIANRLAAIRHLMEMLRRQGHIPDNPAEGLYVRDARRRLPHGLLDASELEGVWLSYEAATPRRRRDRVAAGLLCMQGLRIPEIAALELGDIDLRNGTATVRATRKAEGRTIPLQARQAGEMYLYLQEWKPSKYLLETAGGNGWGSCAQRLVRELGHPAMRLRASRIACWAQSLGLRRAQYLAGHRYASSTERYLRADPEALRRAVLETHPLDRRE